MSKRHLVAGFLCGLFVAVISDPAARGDDDSQESADASVMEQKLEHAQGVLSALVREDFEAMGVRADELMELSEEQWVSRETPEYRSQLKDFWIVLEGIKTAADEENLDGATLAYVQMTLSCVRCHKYLRNNPE